MEGVQGGASRWRSLKERLGFKGMGCCGASWSFKASDMAVRESDDEEVEEEGRDQDRVQAMEMEEETEFLDLGCMNQDDPPAAAAGMNLATALAAERHLRAAQDLEGTTTTSDFAPETTPPVTATTATTPGTPLTLRVSLMKLLEEEGEGVEGVAVNGEKEGQGGGGGGGSDGMCCVCMGRRKGAAFIPCGHTFCRVCSREIWLNRGSCPLCNRSILEILDIF